MPYLESAHAEGANKDWSMAQVIDMLRSDTWMLLGVIKEADICGAGAVCVTRTGLRSVLEIVLFGADMNSKQWIETLDQLKTLAARYGCTAIQGRGRPGWARYLRATPTNSWELEV
jgi:hypothetical protein